MTDSPPPPPPPRFCTPVLRTPAERREYTERALAELGEQGVRLYLAELRRTERLRLWGRSVHAVWSSCLRGTRCPR
jgi:hypothetical protein